MREKIKKAFQIIRETFSAFREDDGLTLAAALSFYAILSLIPLSVIVVSLLGHFLGRSEEAMERILLLITEAVPGLTPPFLDTLTSLIQRPLASGWVGVIFLILIASVLFTNLEKALDKIFRAIRSRNFFHSRLLSVGVIFLISLLLFVPAVLKNIDVYFSEHAIPIQLASFATGNLFFFAVGWVSFVLTVALIPNHEVEVRYNLLGGGVFAALLLAAKYLFRWYIAFSFERLHWMYGSLTALVLIILWIFYLMVLLLLCAEWVGVLQRRGK